MFRPVVYKKNSRLNENSSVLTGLFCAKPQKESTENLVLFHGFSWGIQG